MDHKRPAEEVSSVAQDILGYINFSSGAPDPRFLENINKLFGWLAAGLSAESKEPQKPQKTKEPNEPATEPTWRALANLLRNELQAVRGVSDAFRQVEQVETVLGLVFDAALPAYREFHRDLLFHQTEETLFRPFFIGRVCEAVLQQGGPWRETGRIVPAAVRQLNDFIGYRPVAVLRTEQKIQPYDHEWVRPIPLWIRGVGVAAGPYAELIETALAILDAADPSLLFEAMFSLEQLDELAMDPRAYDFDHPVNKRPNYLFGQWDMHKLDNAGLCRRFVLQQAALDAMLDRVNHRGRLPRSQVLMEEAAVLAGTMLMGSGVSGSRPDAHDSTATLATLLEKIAAYRDVFYERLLQTMKGRHAERLRAEATALRQPFGAARQHFNHFLSQQRARQLEHVHLAQMFAAIDYAEAAARQVNVVPVASARMTCEMHCHISAAHLAIERGRLDEAAAQLPPIEDLLHRAIRCGAMADPWNVLGFGGEFSLFPAVENTVHDHRIDELLDTMGDIFSLYGRIHKAAAAAGNDALQHSLSRSLAALADWWDKFATVEVNSVEGISGQETLESAESVAAALWAWHEAGAAAGDVAFWRRHVEHFRSPKAYAQVVDTLLDRRDPVAAMALLVQWLSQADKIPLVEEDYSFHDLALAWMEDLWEADKHGGSGVSSADAAAEPPSRSADGPPPSSAAPPPDRWSQATKFLDYLEANAEEYWQVPRFDVTAGALGDGGFAEDDLAEGKRNENGGTLGDDLSDGGDFFAEGEEEEGEEKKEEEEEEEGKNLFRAAYEDVTYRDSTDDGVEGEVFEGGENFTDFELVDEAERIINRINFLTTVAQLWKFVATASAGETRAPAEGGGAAGRDAVLAGWLDQATRNHRKLLELLASVHRHRIIPPRGSYESLIEYDQRRSVKETLAEEIIQTCVETADAATMIRASMARPPAPGGAEEWERLAGEAISAALRGDAAAVCGVFPKLCRALVKQPLLYIALGQGGNPQRIVASRCRQDVLRRLLSYLPRLGLLTETCRLLETAQRMEVEHPVGPGAITEFDGIFEIGCKAIIQCLAVSDGKESSKEKSKAEKKKEAKGKKEAELFFGKPVISADDDDLIDCIEDVVEVLLRCWLGHSRGVRLSVLENVHEPRAWNQLKRFIESYGADLFTQRFMNMGNLRGILHQGAEEYLETLQEEADPDEQFRLLADLDAAIPLDEAAHWLGVTIEAVVENYGEYIDYNSITTQSDRGDMLYTLLDFLRLRANYDRLAWNLRPVMLAHQVLVRCGRDSAAEVCARPSPSEPRRWPANI